MQKLTPLKRRRPQNKSKKQARKKHVESMFLVNRNKDFPYYFKDRKLSTRVATQPFKFHPQPKKFSIKVLESGYITIAPLKATMRLFKWFIKFKKIEDQVTIGLNVFPDFVLTSKPKEMRMGKGKGAPDSKVAPIKAGSVILTVTDRGAGRYLTRKLVEKLSWKIPYKHEIVYNNW